MHALSSRNGRSERPLVVCYIAGLGRSGSTLLGNLLDSAEGIVHGGELRFVWQRGMLEDRPVGDGSPFSRSVFWKNVLERAFGRDGVPDAARLEALARRLRHRTLPTLVLPGLRRRFLSSLAPLAGPTCALYHALADATGSDVIVDSSKHPAYGLFLTGLQGIEVRTVHLLRDPRATAFSWMHPKPLDNDPGEMQERIGPVKSSLLWSVSNVATATLLATRSARYLRLRYEDLTTDPQQTLDAVLALLGRSAGVVRFVDDHRIELPPNRSVFGNPGRFQSGLTVIRRDERWLAGLSPRHRSVVDLLTAPLRPYFGYPRSPGRSATP